MSSFNPTLVRLGPVGGNSAAPEYVSFQSHFGSIGARGAHTQPPGLRAFNPTLVRLGPDDLLLPLTLPISFNPTLVRLGLTGFCQANASPIPFNPTLVRLGLHAHRHHQQPSLAFQSHFGSIGASSCPSCPTGRTCFQSHFGSIGAWSSGRCPGCWPRLSIPLWFDWGPCNVPVRTGVLASFNPTLVRLGRRTCWPSPAIWSGFQSHFGSIGASMERSPGKFEGELSIPLWFDWGPGASQNSPFAKPPFNPTLVRLGLLPSGKTFSATTLSIPLWFDWGPGHPVAPAEVGTLSIPLWFDWGLAPQALPAAH